MAKLLLVGLVLTFLVVVSPSLRGHAAPHVETVLNPLHEWSVQNRVRDIAQAIEDEVGLGRRLPGEDDLRQFLRRRYSGEAPHEDAWGTPYYLEATRGRLVVGSAGRDRTPGTERDLRSEPVSVPRR